MAGPFTTLPEVIRMANGVERELTIKDGRSHMAIPSDNLLVLQALLNSLKNDYIVIGSMLSILEGFIIVFVRISNFAMRSAIFLS